MMYVFICHSTSLRQEILITRVKKKWFERLIVENAGKLQWNYMFSLNAKENDCGRWKPRVAV